MTSVKPDKLQRILVKLGSNPKRSVRFFVAGLVIFFAGILIIYVGAIKFHWLQLLGSGLLVVGIFTALKGYLGILANRLAFFRHQSQINRQKYKHLE